MVIKKNNINDIFNVEEFSFLCSSINDICLVEYNGEDVSSSLAFYDFAINNDIQIENVSSIILFGIRKQKVLKNVSSLEELFPDANIKYIQTKQDDIDFEDSCFNHTYIIHFLNTLKRPYLFDSKDTYRGSISENRFLYDAIIDNSGDELICELNNSLLELTFGAKEEYHELSDYCAYKKNYIQHFITTSNYEDGFFLCMEEVLNGCNECRECTNYGKEKNCPFFQHQIAEFYRHGWYVPANEEIAHQWDLKSSKQGYKEAIVAVADDMYYGKGCNKDKTKAATLYAKFARKQDSHCTNMLINNDNNELYQLVWNIKKANAGDIDLQKYFANCFKEGNEYLPKDDMQYEEWMTRAALTGDVEFIEELAIHFRETKKYDNSIFWYNKLKELDDEISDIDSIIDDILCCKIKDENLSDDEIANIGDNYNYGYGVSEDKRLACLYYKVAIESRNPLALNRYAEFLYDGDIIEEDKETAIEYYRESASQNFVGSIVKLIELYNSDEYEDYETVDYWKEKLNSIIENFIPEESDTSNIIEIGDLYSEGELVSKDQEKAFELFSIAAKRNHPKAIFLVGWSYCEGNGVAQNHEIAIQYFNEAASKGHLLGIRCMGCCYLRGYSVRKNFSEAYKWFMKGALRGHDRCMNEVGKLLFDGDGVNQDKAKAIEWFNKSAEKGYADAQSKLGEIYYWGNGTPRDYSLSRKWSSMAAEQGNSHSMFRYAYLLSNSDSGETNYTEAIKWYQKCADKGSSAAMNNLGCLYESGQGVEQNYEEAAKWYLKSAENGDGVGACNIAKYYLDGKGLEKDIEKAITWFETASNRGYSLADTYLGDLYRNGVDVEQDNQKALEYYEKAINKGHDNDISLRGYKVALTRLGFAYYSGNIVEQDYDKAIEYYRLGAEIGLLDCFYYLGLFYQNGYSVEKDIKTAIYWYRKAATKGHISSQNKLKELGTNWVEFSNDDDDDLPF